MTPLEQVRDLFLKPGTWTQEAMARDIRGQGCSPDDPRAVRWCLSGALHKSRVPQEDIMRLCKAIYALTGGHSPIYFNDLWASDQSDIVAVLERATKKEPGQ